jgi:glycosyltransferase involved in cell wall biosynthesis
MRLAWFSPWPPQPSGVAGRSVDAVRALAGRDHAIDVFVDEQAVAVPGRLPNRPPAEGECRIQSAHEFVWRHARGQYDLVVYQIGNSRAHEFIWPYLFRWPGLVVMHDGRVHHARGRALLTRGRKQAYREEFWFNQPDTPDASELAVYGIPGIFFYQWPMVGAIVKSARLVAAHSHGLKALLEEDVPGRPVEYIGLGYAASEALSTSRREAVRASWHATPEHIVFGVFGGLTREKRIRPILRAFAEARRRVPHARLVFGGKAGADIDLPVLVESLGLSEVTHWAPSLDDREFEDSIAAVDVSLNMRWPTAVEMSGPWVQALAAARPTIIVDHAHLVDVPTLDPRTWRRHSPGLQSIDADARAVAIAVDLLDEVHSLRLAIEMLAENATLRERLGAAARTYWEREHTVERMTDDYQRAISRAAAMHEPDVALPAHLRPDPLVFARQIVAPLSDAARATIEEMGR